MVFKPVVLAILDGWGLAKPSSANAISLADLPNMTQWWRDFPHARLIARGEAVGLPDHETGNSEVGHLNLGAGYVVPQDLVRIDQAIKDGQFFSNQALVNACQTAKARRKALHLLMMIGPGQVHSSIDHLWAMLKLAQQQGVAPVYIHAFGDGRDSSPTWLGKNAEAVEAKAEKLGGQFVSLVGRYFAMDRDQRWERTNQAYQLLTERKGQRAANLETAAQHSYARQVTDEFIEPTVLGNGRAIEDEDSVVFLNFRTDRPRQLSRMIADPHFRACSRPVWRHDLFFVTMTDYEDRLPVSAVAFPPEPVAWPLARVVSEAGLPQLHASETEKYAHVTYFFNGGREEPFSREDRLQVPTPKVATYDFQPEMSAIPLTDQVIAAVKGGKYAVVILNYANADMVAHTGKLGATIKAVETVDQCLGRLWAAVEKQGGAMLITADHGNAEVLRQPNGEVDTQHNPSDVPLIGLGHGLPGRLTDGSLANVAPTLLELLGLQPPSAMTAQSLWQR